MEALFATIWEAGLAGAALLDAYNAVIGATVGFVGVEFAGLPHGEKSDTLVDRRREQLDTLDPQRFPTLAANRSLLDHAFGTRAASTTWVPQDNAFDSLLDLLIEGIRTRTLA